MCRAVEKEHARILLRRACEEKREREGKLLTSFPLLLLHSIVVVLPAHAAAAAVDQSLSLLLLPLSLFLSLSLLSLSSHTTVAFCRHSRGDTQHTPRAFTEKEGRRVSEGFD